MDVQSSLGSNTELEVRKGPWTPEEDSLLLNYVSIHGEGQWNFLARYAGLKRTGKSCRLRWLNYLRPDVRRGNLTLQEQLLILQLHSRWGNRWSKIAQEIPGRTDNEIKNYWRTRVQKQAKQLNCDVNSQQFRDTVRYVWIPHLMERLNAASSSSSSSDQSTPSSHDPNSKPKITFSAGSSDPTHCYDLYALDMMQNGSGTCHQYEIACEQRDGEDPVEHVLSEEDLWFLHQLNPDYSQVSDEFSYVTH